MLSPHDTPLVRGDPSLPGLATLLDPEAFGTVLSQIAAAADLGSVRPIYARYKPGTSCLVTYQIEVANSLHDVHAMAYRPQAIEKRQKPLLRTNVPGPLGPGVVTLDDTALTISFFPNDRGLRALKDLCTHERRRKCLSKTLPDHPWLWDSTLTTLRYKPRRRYVAQMTVDGQARAVMKLYDKESYQPALRHATAFASRGRLQLARPLGYSEHQRIIVFEWLPGKLLSDWILRPDAQGKTLEAVGDALVQVHGQDPSGLACQTRHAEAARVQDAATEVAHLCPHLAHQARVLGEKMAHFLLSRPQAHTPLHGDFYAKQVLIDQDVVAVIDFDDAVRGDPAADLGNFVAHLDLDALRGHFSWNRAQQLSQAFLEGYRQATRQTLPPHVGLYQASALLRLATQPFRYRQRDWPQQTQAVLERAQTLLDGLKPTPAGRPSRRTQGHVATTVDIPVSDPFTAATDPDMPALRHALNPHTIRTMLDPLTRRLTRNQTPLTLIAIRVTRHKPGRRCMIEYDLTPLHAHSMLEPITLVAKVRARGLDKTTYRLVHSLWNGGFDRTAGDGLCVPEPIGVIPPCHMWLQRKISGTVATRLITKPKADQLTARIAEATYKLHRTGIPAPRVHTIEDELNILHKRLGAVAQATPDWDDRITRILKACVDLSHRIPPPQMTGIHRDFYADQVIVSGSRLFVIDFDLYCLGDPGLDVGNFLGHMTEQALRAFGDPCALADREQVMEDRFVELAGERTRPAVRAYATLTLVRHIHLSTLFPDRRPWTARLLELCEERLLGAKTIPRAVSNLLA